MCDGFSKALAALLPIDIAILHAIAFVHLMRMVLDTDIMVAAIRSGLGASRRLLTGALQQEYTLLLSVPLIFEYEAVMSRPEHLAAARLSTADVTALLDAVVRVAEPIRLAFLWRPMLKDPNDDMVLEAAVNGQADRLVSFNLRDYGTIGAQFGIVVCSPADAMRALEGRS